MYIVARMYFDILQALIFNHHISFFMLSFDFFYFFVMAGTVALWLMQLNSGLSSLRFKELSIGILS